MIRNDFILQKQKELETLKDDIVYYLNDNLLSKKEMDYVVEIFNSLDFKLTKIDQFLKRQTQFKI